MGAGNRQGVVPRQTLTKPFRKIFCASMCHPISQDSVCTEPASQGTEDLGVLPLHDAQEELSSLQMTLGHGYLGELLGMEAGIRRPS